MRVLIAEDDRVTAICPKCLRRVTREMTAEVEK